MATPKEQYADELLEVAKRYDNLDDKTVKRLIALLQNVRVDMAATLTSDISDFERFRLSSLRDSVDDIILGFQSGLTTDLNAGLVGGGQLGVDMVANPLETIGLNVSSFNTLAPAQVNVALDFSAELVQNITSDLRSTINTQLRQAALAQKTPFQAMKDITTALGVNPDDGIWGTKNRPDVVKGVAARSEAIVRTEMTRIHNLTQSSTQQEAGNLIPGLLKRWIATPRGNTRQTHINAHRRTFNEPIPIDEPFKVGRSELMYPGDPRGEAKETINCRCTMATIVPEIGVQETPLDKSIDKELKKRKEKPLTPKPKPKPTIKFVPELKQKQREHIANLAAARDMKNAGLPDVARSIIGESKELIQREKDISRVARQEGFNPAKMSQKQWLKLADDLQVKSSEELRFSTDIRRQGVGRKASRAADVTKRDARKLVTTLDDRAKQDAVDYLEKKLINFGYDKNTLAGLSENRKSRLEQVRRLHAEIGHGIPQKGKIGKIPLTERQRIIDRSVSDVIQSNAMSYAKQPLTAQGLDTWELYKRATEKGGLLDPPFIPDELFEELSKAAPSYVLKAGG